MRCKNDFAGLYDLAYPEVEKIIRKYDGWLLTQRLLDSVKRDLYSYKCSLKHEYCVEEETLDRIIRRCYRDAVQADDK